MPILNKTNVEKMLAEVRPDKDPVNSFITTRRVMSHFMILIKKDGSDAIVDLLQVAAKKLEQCYENINPGQIQSRETFKALDLLLTLLKEYNTVMRVAGYAIDTVHYIIRSSPAADLKRIHKTLVELFSDRLSQLYQERANGRVMMKCLQMLFHYICKFPSRVREEALADLVKSLAKDDDDQLLAMGKWKMQSVEQCSRSFANSLKGAKFYLLAVSSASCGGCNLKPSTGQAIYVEFNNVVLNYSFEALEENKESARLVVVRYADIQKYKIINDKNGSCVEVQLQDAAMRFNVIYAEDLLELRQFLSTTIGNREENVATSLDMIITHIRLDESSVFNRDRLRHASVDSSVLPQDTRLTLQPSVFASIELHDTTAPCSSRALEQERDATLEKGGGNGRVNPVTDDKGGARPDLDPYDTSHIRDEDSLAPSSPGRKRGLGAAKNAPPSNRKPNKKNEPLPSLIKSMAQHRAQKSATNGYERPAPADSANCKARNNTAAQQSMSIDEDVENNGHESDDSWQPVRQKAPPMTAKNRGRDRRPLTAMKVSTETTFKQQGKEPGRRASVISVERTTAFPCNKDLAANIDCVDSDSIAIYEMLQQIQKNHIFESNSSSSSASIGRKRKSPANENVTDQGTTFQPSATHDGMRANKRFEPSPRNSMLDVAPSESLHRNMDLRPQDSSNTSFQPPCGMDVSLDQTSSQVHYVVHHIANPIIEDWKTIRERNMANVENYMNPILNTRQEHLKLMKEKKALFMQYLQAADKEFEKIMELQAEFQRICPSDSELEQRIRKAKDDDDKLTEKMKDDTARIEKTIEEAAAHDWESVKLAYVKQVNAAFDSEYVNSFKALSVSFME